MLWYSTSINFVRHLEAGGKKLVLAQSAQVYPQSAANVRPSVTQSLEWEYCCCAVKQALPTIKCKSSITGYTITDGISLFDLISGLSGRIQVLPTAAISNKLEALNVAKAGVFTEHEVSRPNVRPNFKGKAKSNTGTNFTLRSKWLGFHHSFSKYANLRYPEANWGMCRYYHSHSDGGADLELQPNTFNSAEKTRKFVRKLRRRQRALLLTEIQMLNQKLNKEAIQEDPGMLLPPSREQLRLVALHNAVPFIGFGFLDNAIMIIAGDYIDWRIGAVLGISTLAAAGLGNLISDLAGVVLAGYVEAFANKFGIPPHNLSLEQYDMRGPRIASAVGRCAGIALGCLLGMFPLLFLKPASKDETDTPDEKKE